MQGSQETGRKQNSTGFPMPNFGPFPRSATQLAWRDQFRSVFTAFINDSLNHRSMFFVFLCDVFLYLSTGIGYPLMAKRTMRQSHLLKPR